MDTGVVIFGVVIIVLVVASTAMGWWVGPALSALGFLGLGALCLFGGGGQQLWVGAGVLFLSAGIVELAAASVFWDAGAVEQKPSGAWRATAVLVEIGGTVGFFALLVILAVALVGFYSQL